MALMKQLGVFKFVISELLPPALPDAGHVHLVPAEDVKLVIIKHVGSDAQNVRKLLRHWPERTEEERRSNTTKSFFLQP